MRRPSVYKFGSPGLQVNTNGVPWPQIAAGALVFVFPIVVFPTVLVRDHLLRGVPEARSNSDFVALADRVLLYGMGVGRSVILQPLSDGGCKWGLLIHPGEHRAQEIVTGHMLPQAPGA